MLHVSGLCKTYHVPAARNVLRNIDLELSVGDYIAIIGKPGSGKSTLLNMIAGLDLPDRGTVTLNGVAMDALDEVARARLRRRHMGFVFQAFLLLPHLTVLDNAALSLKINDISHREAQHRAFAALTAMGLASAIHRFPNSLSNGEAQRVALARALAHQPQLVLADEPTGDLDAETAGIVLQLLRQQIKAQGCMGILVTHSAAAAAGADRVYHLGRNGLRLARAA